MIIKAFACGPFGTNAYIVSCPQTHEAVIIDPAPGSAPILADYLSKNHLTPRHIFLTHSHWDHIADVATLKAKYNIPVWIHRLDAPNLEHPGADGLPCWINIPAVKPDHFFEEGMKVGIGSLTFNVIHTPGHSPGCVCLYSPEEGILISGDTLFKGSIGNISFPTAQPDLMWKSLDKLAHLPPETKVFPGHGESTSIKAERWLPDAKKHFGGY